MGEPFKNQWAQFVFFKTRMTISDDIFQETWIPQAKALKARGINSIILSQKINAKNDMTDIVFMSKTWWDALSAFQKSFPQGCDTPPSLLNEMTCLLKFKVGCFRVRSTKTASGEMAENRHEGLVEDEIKVLMMRKQPLPKKELLTTAENLSSLKGFQSYCIYELENGAFSEIENDFCSCIIEVFIQKYFKDVIMEDIDAGGKFTGWKLAVHEDVVKFTILNANAVNAVYLRVDINTND
ncbi:uncharacterized protein LOC124440562 [Xenia sp. Carnegie-2017]|uniref:uncharacterized protein LOC124440562 n=1 Tax=Xenia sp. Carnegie-2017 TaxID=2897299 RepID=UPI001F04D101|nr:uncharacterized protein LOC124440562 [Xenia sp. Carnegie-2017]